MAVIDELIEARASGDDDRLRRAKLDLFEANIGILATIHKRRSHGMTEADAEDLRQELMMTLWLLIDRYDPAASAFSTFAHATLAWKALTLRRRPRTVATPVAIQQARSRIARENDARRTIGQPPHTAAELAELGFTKREIEESSAPPHHYVPFDYVDDDQRLSLAETLASETDVEHEVWEGAGLASIRAAIGGLSPRLRDILERRLNEQTLDEIGREHGITKERVRVLLLDAVHSLRATVTAA